MSSEHSINLQSLNVVRDELIATIEASARELENFVVSKQEDVDALQASIDGVQQICGILKVLELDSAALLAEELLKVANSISPGAAGHRFDRKLEVVSNTFFVLPRYLEYLEQAQRQLPVVLIPHINALRKLHDESALLESHFCRFKVLDDASVPQFEKHQVTDQAFRSEIRRARNMYQLGLTAVLKDRNVTNALALMRRGTKRLLRMSGSDAGLSRLWFLTDTVLEALSEKNMAIMQTRKFLFMRIDRIIRQVELGGPSSLSASAPKGLIKELVYLIALSQYKSAAFPLLESQVKLVRLPYTETELQKEYASLYGPSEHTISSLAHVLSAEVGSAKRTLEAAAQADGGSIQDVNSFISVLTNIAEILNVVGLREASTSLREQIKTVKLWGEDNGHISPETMTQVANTFLYLESTINDLQNHTLNGHRAGSQDAQVVSYELASAMQIVKEECLGGLSLTKRALNSYADSNYDTGHIKNIAKTLTTIRGAMQLLKKERVSNILSLSVEFVEDVLMDSDLPAAINEVLETFADVIIAIEYFFDSADSLSHTDDSVLKIAEESLGALGYDVA